MSECMFVSHEYKKKGRERERTDQGKEKTKYWDKEV